MKIKNWQNPKISLISQAVPLEEQASLTKDKQLIGRVSVKPEDFIEVGKKYEKAGDLRREAHDYVGAEDDYVEANKYGFAYSETDSNRVKGKIEKLVLEKRKAMGLPLQKRAWTYLAIISFASAFLSISLKLTGSVVGASSAKSNWISLGLFLLGCMFTLFYFRAKRK